MDRGFHLEHGLERLSGQVLLLSSQYRGGDGRGRGLGGGVYTACFIHSHVFPLIGSEGLDECLTRSSPSFVCICCSISFLFVLNFWFIHSCMHLFAHSVHT